jgi:hypothetical protein
MQELMLDMKESRMANNRANVLENAVKAMEKDNKDLAYFNQEL